MMRMNARKIGASIAALAIIAAAAFLAYSNWPGAGAAAAAEQVPLVCRSCAYGFSMPLEEFLGSCDDTGQVACPSCGAGKAARGALCVHCGRPVAFIEHGLLVETCPGCGQDPCRTAAARRTREVQ